MLFLILSLLDIIAGLSILLVIKTFIPIIITLIFLKGAYSFFSSLRFPCLITFLLSLIDIAAGISLYFVNLGISNNLITTIGILEILKGIYSIFTYFSFR